MEHNIVSPNTPAWRFQVWASFILSAAMTLVGIYSMEMGFWEKGFLFMGVIFTIGSCFTLAKTVRDDHELEKLANRVSIAKQEKALKEFES
ncbi:MAG: YiaA/YiaB family inner membrane protein [Bacteroidota bacterium]